MNSSHPSSSSEAQNSLRIEILEQIEILTTAGFGLVAALAWNSAIQDVFQYFFPNQQSVILKFVYALFITIVVVVFTSKLRRFIRGIKSQLHYETKY